MIEVRNQTELDRALARTNNGHDELIVCLGGRYTLRENSTATLWENSTATLWENSTATLRGNSTATLRENSTATLRENSTATLRENSTATLRGNSTATLRENSTATLRENSTATLRENSTATLWENSTATLRENSTATLRGNSTATLWENSTATLRENSTATLWENSTATLRENSTATLWENSTATLWGNSTARVHDRSTVEATPDAVVLQHSDRATITGGRVLPMIVPKTAAEWCAFYGIETTQYSEVARHGVGASNPEAAEPFYAADETGGPLGLPVAILYKAVGEDYHSRNGADYTPGTTPEAKDWDGGDQECGGGLHFSPHPRMAEAFHPNAPRFLACPVLLEEIAVHPDGRFPEKVKARRVAAPCWEVNADGERV